MKAAKTTKKRTNSAWWNSKEGRKWLAEKIRFEADLEIASELRKFC